MKPFPRVGFVVVVVAQVLVLLGMMGQRIHLLRTGRVVRLSCAPVDPRSFLSGDYVTLNYEITNLGRRWNELNAGGETWRDHQTIYVGLAQREGSPFWEAREVSHDREKLRAKWTVVIRGVLEHHWTQRVRYGVEAFFVPQFQGLDIERHMRDVSVDVAVADSGESAIRRLFIGDREVRFH